MKTSRTVGWIFLVATLLALGVGGGFYWRFLQEKAEGVQLAKEGRHALEGQQLSEAISRFDAALSKPVGAPLKAEIFAARGHAKNLSGATDGAIADLTEAIQLNPRASAPYAERARTYLSKGDKEKALSDLDAAIAHGSTSPEDYFLRGSLHLEKGDAQKAAADFTETVQRDPNNLAAFLMRARAYTALKDLDAAIASYDSALRIDPKNQEAHAERGDLYSRKGDIDKAMADYGELRTPQGDVWAAHSPPATSPPIVRGVENELLRQAMLAQSANQLDEAIGLYNRILQMNIPLTTASTALQNRGNVYHLQGKDDKALADYEQAIRFNPANAGAYANRGLIYAIRNDTRSAIMDYNEALRFEPHMYEALFNRGLTHRQEGDDEAALRDLTAALAINDTAMPAYLNRAGLYLKQNKLDQAMADVNAAIKNAPDSVDGYLARAQLFGRKHQYAEELKDLQKAAGLKSNAAFAAFNGLAWLRATCPEKSFRDGKQAVADALRACELSAWNQGSLVDTLAAAYAENGQFDKAVNFQLYALTLPGIPEEARGPAEERVKLYRNRQPYRDTESN